VSHLSRHRLDGAALLCPPRSPSRHRLHCIVERRTISQDLKTGFLVGSTPKSQQIAILIGTLASALILGPILMQFNQSGTVYVPVAGNKDFGFSIELSRQSRRYLKDDRGQPKRERLSGAQAGADPNEYSFTTNQYRQRTRRPLSRDNDGVRFYLADPASTGLRETARQFDRPEIYRAEGHLVSYIIKGILGGQLPWGLVLLGVFIAIVLELSAFPRSLLPSVLFPISTSARSMSAAWFAG